MSDAATDKLICYLEVRGWRVTEDLVDRIVFTRSGTVGTLVMTIRHS